MHGEYESVTVLLQPANYETHTVRVLFVEAAADHGRESLVDLQPEICKSKRYRNYSTLQYRPEIRI